MLEVLLIIGLLFILGVVVLIHFVATSTQPWVLEITGVSADPSLHPICFLVETILILSIMYIFKALIS